MRKDNTMFEVIVNPNGASGESMKVWKQVEPVFQASGKPYSVHYSDADHGIRQLVEQLSQKTCDIVVVGGDGSLNHAVNGLSDYEHVRLGLISVGSGNDFYRSIGVKKDPVSNAGTILEGKTVRTIDVGEVIYHNRFDICTDEKMDAQGHVHHRFVISTGIGFDAAICHDAESSQFKKIFNHLGLGRLIYLATAIRLIFHTSRTQAWITTDGKTAHYENMLLSIVMNEMYEGGGFRFCPAAKDHDGLLDQCTGDGLSAFDFFRIFPCALSGNHVRFKGIYTDTLRETEIRTELPLWVHTDGETFCKSSHITVRLCAEKLNLLI
ncbi:MAG: diacylglycerol/lipid kinase family protein [Bulleidia sp.]